MRLKDLRVPIIVISMIATLALLLGGQFLYQKYYIEKPLFKLIQETKTVKNLELLDENQERNAVLVVEFRDVENIKTAYAEVGEKAEAVLGHPVPIRITDRRSTELSNVLEQSQFAVNEAIMNGNFTKMADVIAEQVRSANLDRYAVYVDQNNIYIQLHKGGNYLYEVVPRDQQTVAGRNAVMGSEKS